MKIYTYPDSILRKKAKPVKEINEQVQQLIDDMCKTMHDEGGVGLAATQVGQDRRVIVFDVSGVGNVFAFINPEIIDSGGEIVSEEGCLSIPGYFSEVKRAKNITVKALNRKGEEVTLSLEGFPAVVVQHEIDHLNGILFIDRISKLKKDLYKRSLKK
jgi:peptide deformylase